MGNLVNLDVKAVRRFALAGSIVLITSGTAKGLDLGFELSSSVYLSDNIGQLNAGLEEQGNLGVAELSVFGSHESRRVIAGFLGELGARRVLQSDTEQNLDINAVTRFYGSVEYNLTKQFSWYLGDVLGGTVRDNAIDLTDDSRRFDNRRNVLVTGPRLKLDFGARSSLESQLFYVNNSDDSGAELADFYELQLDYTSDLGGGLGWGWRLDNVRVDNPDEALEPDYNRLTLGLTGSRIRGLNSLDVFVGGTQYQAEDAEDFAVNGLAAQINFARRTSEFNSFYADLSRSVVDQTLSSTESLLETGDSRIPEVAGVYNDTILTFGQDYATSFSSYSWSIGAGLADYEALVESGNFVTADADEEDQTRYFASLILTRSMSPRLILDLALNYRQEEFNNRSDHTESAIGELGFSYLLTPSLQASVSYSVEMQEGLETVAGVEEIIDITENKVLLTLVYAPPTRAVKDEIVRLKSLLY